MKKNILATSNSYINRLLNSVYINLLVLILIAFIVNSYLVTTKTTFIFYHNIIFIVLIFEQILLAIIRNKYLIKEICIDTEKNIFKILTYKYNKIDKITETDIDNIKVEIKAMASIGKRPDTIYMVIYERDRKIIKQRQLGGWTAEQFIEILKFINDYKGKPTYIHYITKHLEK